VAAAEGTVVHGADLGSLLFAHWPVRAEELEHAVPPQLPVDIFEGHAWIGVTPFLVRGLRLRWTPPVPVLSTFPEINVRTHTSPPVDGPGSSS
jgi:uncharacterized protein YqjF (DUF2071 family)